MNGVAELYNKTFNEQIVAQWLQSDWKMHKCCISPVSWLVPSLDVGCLEVAVVNLFALVAANLLALAVVDSFG